MHGEPGSLAETTFILVRHGQSTGNLSGGTLMGGWTDLPLTPHGLREAGALAERLLAEPPVTVICSSPLQRAVQTAAVLLQRLTIGPVLLEPALREIGCGDVDGWPTPQVQLSYPDEWARNLEQSDPDFRWPRGESYREFRERVLQTVGTLAQRYPAQRVLLVTHAGVISQLIGWIRGESPARWEPYRPRNCSITELRWRGDHGEIARFDDQGDGRK